MRPPFSAIEPEIDLVSMAISRAQRQRLGEALGRGLYRRLAGCDPLGRAELEEPGKLFLLRLRPALLGEGVKMSHGR